MLTCVDCEFVNWCIEEGLCPWQCRQEVCNPRFPQNMSESQGKICRWSLYELLKSIVIEKWQCVCTKCCLNVEFILFSMDFTCTVWMFVGLKMCLVQGVRTFVLFFTFASLSCTQNRNLEVSGPYTILNSTFALKIRFDILRCTLMCFLQPIITHKSCRDMTTYCK